MFQLVTDASSVHGVICLSRMQLHSAVQWGRGVCRGLFPRLPHGVLPRLWPAGRDNMPARPWPLHSQRDGHVNTSTHMERGRGAPRLPVARLQCPPLIFNYEPFRAIQDTYKACCCLKHELGQWTTLLGPMSVAVCPQSRYSDEVCGVCCECEG